MKKALPLIIIALAVGGILYSIFTPVGPKQERAESPAATDAEGSSTADRKMAPEIAQTFAAQNGEEPPLDGGTEGEMDEIRPAAEIYKSAADALEAVKKGSLDYDDVILEQFTQPGDDCTWCGEFYKSISELLKAGDTKPDQKSYFAELLAISGRVDNVQSLVDAIKSAQKPEDRELFQEALELTIGKDDVVAYLGKQLSKENTDLRDTIVAAITNQSSPLAIDTLYKFTIESGDPDGFYSNGIGLGEVIPDEESMPKIREIVQKRDQFSHLGVKALLNGGMTGLRTVMDVLANSSDPDFDKKMLKDAVDHVIYEEETEKYLKDLSENAKQPLVKEFAKQILDDFAVQQEEDIATEPVASEGQPVQIQ